MPIHIGNCGNDERRPAGPAAQSLRGVGRVRRTKQRCALRRGSRGGPAPQAEISTGVSVKSFLAGISNSRDTRETPCRQETCHHHEAKMP